MKILLAEDEDALRNTFVRQLVQLGHEVEAFPDGNSLCAALDRGAQAELVCTDLAMPDGDGLHVIKEARRLLPTVQILVVSGLVDGDNVLRALRTGADHFLPKPFDLADLRAVLRRIEAILAAYRDKVRAWHSFVRCDLELRVPADLRVAAATASLFGKHARSFLEDAECRGLRSAVHEILLNSIEHGCLEITREEKVEALSANRYAELIAARRADPALGVRFVHASMTADAGRGIMITLEDPGPGFDPDALPDPADPENLFNESGRGITMARLHLGEIGEILYARGGRTAILLARGRASPSPQGH